MQVVLVQLIIFAAGVTLGAMLGYVVATKRERSEIEGALDTIGIRRKEFMRLKNEVDAIWRMINESDDRIKMLEQFK